MKATTLGLDPNSLGSSVPEERRLILQKLVDHIAIQRTCCERADLIFICTQNSRRSHLAHIWASVAAAFHGVKDVHLWSGGTEVTEMNVRVVESLKRSGLDISSDGDRNPHYKIQNPFGSESIVCFSKRWDDPSNPQEDFAAVMVCSEAEAACPFIPNALLRVALPYNDPKESDGTDDESSAYDRRSEQIAEEMFWLFKQLRTDE